MRKMRKGFTLVELLIVIGIISILGAMGMVGGSEANNIATANKIIEEFRIIGAAMNMYYADSKATVDALTEGIPAKILEGIAPYMKSVASITAADTGAVGKYNISVVNGEWWLTYTLQAANSKVALILKNKAADEGLKATSTTVEGTTVTEATDYDGEATVCWKVR